MSKSSGCCTKDNAPLCFAGLWDRYKTADAGAVESFTIITQPAGAPLNSYHDRAPIVLHQADWSTWLDFEADVRPLLGPESADAFNVTPVSGRAPRSNKLTECAMISIHGGDVWVG